MLTPLYSYFHPMLLTILIAGLVACDNSGTKSLIWTDTKQFGIASAVTKASGISVDSKDNVVVVGTLGERDMGVTISSFFVIKYDATGNKQWTKQPNATSLKESFGNAVSTDSKGNVFVTGYTEGNLSGNSFVGLDFFVIKYNATGIRQWTKQLGDNRSKSFGRGISIDNKDNVIVTGYTDAGLDGDSSSGFYNCFITKFDSFGTKQWTKQVGTQRDTKGTAISIDSKNNVIVTGYTSGGLDGNKEFGTFDFFVTKYNALGIKQWTKQLGVKPFSTKGFGVSVDSKDNIVVTGDTSGGFDGEGLDGNSRVGRGDSFVTKYDASGVKQWTKELGVTSAETGGTAISIDSKDNIIVTGYTQGGLDGNTLMGNQDLFITKYNATGDKQWTKQLGVASAITSGTGISIDSKDNIVVTGTTNGELDGINLIGVSDLFVIKYNSDGIKL